MGGLIAPLHLTRHPFDPVLSSTKGTLAFTAVLLAFRGLVGNRLDGVLSTSMTDFFDKKLKRKDLKLQNFATKNQLLKTKQLKPRS
ncbi:hypothetical protein EA58_18175 [Photobacterium galatheae]|uniref:Uncharacterized protein n=1 Tax=Photobacterium galatheae TaxID=1654360 RepID=A0A066RMC1_9GAMM|nr:hypothetical protein EA58_18175 [Photobacterium galatheae]